MVALVETSRGSGFESQDVVPVRINGRTGGRFWKRSEEQPVFSLSAFGRDLILNLVPDSSFLAPSFTIQRVRAARAGGASRSGLGDPGQDPPRLMNQTEESEGGLRSCFYSGSVDQDRDSVVAVSLCSGMFGSFITDGTEYLIEPKHGGLSVPDLAEHVIRKRNLTENRAGPMMLEQQSLGETFTHGGADARSQARRRRFVSAPRYIETLAVADSSMSQFYGEEIKVRQHELTLSVSHKQTCTSLFPPFIPSNLPLHVWVHGFEAA